MSLEQSISELTAAVKQLIVVASSGAVAALNDGAATTGGATTTSADTKTADKPATGAKGAKGAKGTKESEKPKDEPPAGPTWAVVVEKIRELNKSEVNGHGREGIKAMLTHFLPDAPDAKVPALEALKKHAEILAWVENRLEGTAEETTDEDDLGI